VSNINFDIWIFFSGGGLYKYPMKNILRRAKFLPNLGLQSKVLAGPLTNWSTWVVFCTSSPLQGVKYQLWYLKFCLWRGTLLISHEKYIKDSKVLAHLGFQSNVLAGPLTNLSAWAVFCTSSPQQGVKYQLGYLIFFGGGSLWKSYEKYIKDGKVLAHLGCRSKELSGPLTDWSAWVGFYTSNPQ
jgi:hypothetical protein